MLCEGRRTKGESKDEREGPRRRRIQEVLSNAED